MQIKIFTIPATGGAAIEEEMNNFLRSHRILRVREEFVVSEEGAYWCFRIRYLLGDNTTSKERKANKRPTIDYREVLDENLLLLFSPNCANVVKQYQKKKA